MGDRPDIGRFHHRKEPVMQRSRLKSLILVASLAGLTLAALAATGRGTPPKLSPVEPVASAGGGITFSGHLVQTRVLKGSPGRVGLELTLAAAAPAAASAGGRGIDFVVVLDRSGSMQGAKLENARHSLQLLLAGLTADDRFALFSYSDLVRKQCDLLPVTDANRALMRAAVAGIDSSGATNLGAGLQAGIDLVTAASRPGHPGRVILISDGLANRGVTDPSALAGMAATAAGREFAVSTVGVGADFNEVLMTRIADRGAGSYYYLENPSAFAEVFRREAVSAKSAAATGISVSIPLPPGVGLVDAAGYPVSVSDGRAVFYPGSLRSGQTRRIFLTLQVPTETEAQFDLSGITARWLQDGGEREARLEQTFTIACIGDPERVAASIDRSRWEGKVLKEDYGRLKQEVASHVRSGRVEAAMKSIDAYENEQKALNSAVGSSAVERNLETDLKDLRNRVAESFSGPPAAAAEKQKAGAKALQYEGYSERR
jgi:Ca-activated chloride channel family protein